MTTTESTYSDDPVMQGIIEDSTSQYSFVEDEKSKTDILNEIGGQAHVGDSAVVNAAVQSILGPGEVPRIPLFNDSTVTLPAGYLDPDGTLFTTAEVRELTGKDEEALAKAGISMVRYNNALMAAVESIGGNTVTKQMIDDLLVGDREALIIGIRIATFGKEITFEEVRCPGCGEDLDITIDLTALDFRYLEDPRERVFTVPLRRGEVKVRLPIVADVTALLEDSNSTVAEENTLMLSRCVEEINGKKVRTLEDVRELGVADRRLIIDFLAKTAPGPRYDEVKSIHESCDTEIPVPLAIDAMFQGL